MGTIITGTLLAGTSAGFTELLTICAAHGYGTAIWLLGFLGL